MFSRFHDAEATDRAPDRRSTRALGVLCFAASGFGIFLALTLLQSHHPEPIGALLFGLSAAVFGVLGMQSVR